jgi:hypothetical protein
VKQCLHDASLCFVVLCCLALSGFMLPLAL